MNDLTITKKYNQRAFKDRMARHFVAVGGISVIMAILLIFFYLLSVVIPMFAGAEVEENVSFIAPGEGKTLHLGLEEQATMGVRFTDSGHIVFFKTDSGDIIKDVRLGLPAKITSSSAKLDRVALGLENGEVMVVRYLFDLSYPNDLRTLTPRLEFPLGEEPIQLDESGQAITLLSFQQSAEDFGLAGVTAGQRIVFAKYAREESFIDDAVSFDLESRTELPYEGNISSMVLTPLLDHIYVAQNKTVLLDYPIDDGEVGEPVATKLEREVTDLKLLLGGNSLLIGYSNGEIQQWMSVRTETGRELTYIRNFDANTSPVTTVETEQQRKSFAVADKSGAISIYYSTSQRTLAHLNTINKEVDKLAWSARAQSLLVSDVSGELHLYDVDNEYPEVSWNALWGKVWYEGYDEPDYIWQSSASTNEFEPKYSLMPLTFGTIKAAFYAMVFAVPIAILGAMFTAQFMAPKMRQTVKPSIEIMEALPTVILGFLAGLWLAPYVETHLAGVFTLLILLPAGFIFCAWLWGFVPNKNQLEGWEAAFLIPVVLFLIWLSTMLSGPIEDAFFNGSLRDHMSNEWGINYDQRNSLVVGLIMGFAVIPTIFSIAEDALFSVPQHLIRGSLALGATRWQTMTFVVLPAASPGIFSAVMMGFGRAVGETMIVLMATGNTPLMDMSIFQGMRTLAANIAVEVPEAEVDSTHYRVLFLAALILFMFTFVFNTMAEMVRHRLRKRYSGL